MCYRNTATYFLLRSLLEKIYWPFISFICTVFLMVGVLLFYNYATNGDPLVFGYQVRWGVKHTFGFTSIPIMDRPSHTQLRGVVNTLSNLITLNQNLFEWPVPSLIPLVILATPFSFKKKWCDYFLLCGFMVAPILYFFYFFQDLCLGPRFYYISVPFILLLTTKALLQIIERISLLRRLPETHVKDAVIFILFLSLVFSGLVRIPKLYRYYSNSFWHVDNKLMKKAQDMLIENALIFQKCYDYENKCIDLGSGFLHNSPGLKDSIIFDRDLGERNSELIPFFPGRSFYIASKNENGELIIEQLGKN